MKKYFSLFLAFVCGLFAVASIPFFHAFATGENKYLISADFDQQDYQTDYDILASEVLTKTRPFDIENSQMLAGASIMPTVNATNKTFDRTYKTNAQTIDQNDSIFIYVFFTKTKAHNLTIVAKDNASNSLSWTILASTLESQIVETNDTQNIRHGWMLIELPVAAAQKTGELATVEKLEIEYNSATISGTIDYSNMYFYAPYINASLSENIAFLNKNNYFLYKAKKKNADFVGDTISYSSLSGLFRYCYIGDIDYLQENTEDYYFKIMMFSLNTGLKKEHKIVSGAVDFSFAFDKAESYELDVNLYNKNDSPIWSEQIDYEISQFVAMYVNNGLAKMKKGQSFDYDIEINDRITNHQTIVATSSNEKVARVEIDGDGKLIVEALSGGKTTITLKMTGQKDTELAKEYVVEYVVEVAKDTSVNWWLMGGIAIFLIVGSFVLYNIMVRKRLIEGKYPKY